MNPTEQLIRAAREANIVLTYLADGDIPEDPELGGWERVEQAIQALRQALANLPACEL